MSACYFDTSIFFLAILNGEPTAASIRSLLRGAVGQRPEGDKEREMMQIGCPYAVIKATSKRAPEICGKIPENGSVYCPKHKLVTEEEPNESARWYKKMNCHKERKANERIALELSPLRAENPDFDKLRPKID